MKVKIGLAKFFTPQLHQVEKWEASGTLPGLMRPAPKPNADWPVEI